VVINCGCQKTDPAFGNKNPSYFPGFDAPGLYLPLFFLVAILLKGFFKQKQHQNIKYVFVQSTFPAEGKNSGSTLPVV
jgi:hypothetical protein